MSKPLVRVLGPIDVKTASGPASAGGPRQRAVLGALVLGGGRAVPIDQLVEAVWGSARPRAVSNALQSYVSGLRDVLGEAAVVRSDHSYLLDLDTVDIDAIEFERLLRTAAEARDDPARCWTLCRDSLSLWRGRPFGDLADDEHFELETLRLEELRLLAMELSLEADLGLGRYELVAGELESAVREYPFRERLWHLLIEALTRSGRRVEALRACHAFRAALAEVGVEPGGEMDALERRILEGRPPERPSSSTQA